MLQTTDAVDEKAEKSHADRIRSNYETEDLGAIMGRFYEAVSWRNN
jgi:hypothetical protein